MALTGSRFQRRQGIAPGTHWRNTGRPEQVVQVRLVVNGDVVCKWVAGQPRGSLVGHTRIHSEEMGPGKKWRLAEETGATEEQSA